VADECTAMGGLMVRQTASVQLWMLGAATQTVQSAGKSSGNASQTAGRWCIVGAGECCGTASFGADETSRGAADRPARC
jgi:hypothetical protein